MPGLSSTRTADTPRRPSSFASKAARPAARDEHRGLHTPLHDVSPLRFSSAPVPTVRLPDDIVKQPDDLVGKRIEISAVEFKPRSSASMVAVPSLTRISFSAVSTALRNASSHFSPDGVNLTIRPRQSSGSTTRSTSFSAAH